MKAFCTEDSGLGVGLRARSFDCASAITLSGTLLSILRLASERKDVSVKYKFRLVVVICPSIYVSASCQ